MGSQQLKCLAQVLYVLGLAPRVQDDIIYIHEGADSKQRCKHPAHGTLKMSWRIRQPKTYSLVGKLPTMAYKRRFLLIFGGHRQLSVTAI